MTKVDIFSGFLGAGKTTLIKKLLSEVYAGQKIVLIENEFGQIGIDGGFLKDAGIEVTEMNSGCICCSLVGDFGKALAKVIETYNPDRILIEPSGVGKLSDVYKAVADCEGTDIASVTTVADASKLKIYLKNFKEFYENQIEHASTIILSRTQSVKPAKIEEAMSLIRGINTSAVVITTPWDELDGKQIFDAMVKNDTVAKMAEELLHEHEHEHHHHHEHGEDCTCGCHDHDHDHDEHEHHHHDHGEDCTCGCHDHDHDHDHDEHEHHHHEHGEDCTCGCHDHDHHHHHHADEVFDSIGFETTTKFDKTKLEEALNELDDADCGMILRAKGIVPSTEEGKWIHFDYVPGEFEVRYGSSDVIGKLCFIGSKVDKEAIKELFGI
ncbi:MAG: GTP-binding protein [Clostridia bacterium]|nr:GTP-binding protein [Clostridia bacterium]